MPHAEQQFADLEEPSMKAVFRLVEVAEFCREDSARVADFLARYFGGFPAGEWVGLFDRMLWRNPNQWAGVPAGWLLETPEREVVGFLGNVAHPYCVEGAIVRAAATSAWCVAPKYHSSGLLLAEAFVEQRNVDLLFNTTANAVAGKLFRRIGAAPPPTDSFREALFWVTRPLSFVAGAVEYRTGSRLAAEFGRVLGGPLLAIVEAARGARTFGQKTRLEAIPPGLFDPDWDDVWQAWSSRLTTGVRTAAQIGWRYSSGHHHLVELRAGAERIGFTAVRVCVDKLLRRLRVSDLWLDPARLDLLPSILQLWRSIAAEKRCGLVEVCGLGNRWRDRLGKLRPYRRRLSTESYFVFARNRGLKERLACAGSWNPTEYDGDTPFSLGTLERTS